MSRPKYRRPRVLQELGFQCRRPNGTAKAAYRSQAKAKQAIRNRNGTADAALYTYRCPRCGLWHITSQPQKGGQR